MAPNPAAELYQPFEGRADWYGTENGGAVEGDAYEAFERHCFKSVPMGIYPMRPGVISLHGQGHLPTAFVKWGCVDIDNGSFEDTICLWQTLRDMGLYPWIETSRSKGYHVWLFAEDWVLAFEMRRTLMFARDVAGLEHIKEVNPKAENFDGIDLGNYVRVPYIGFRPDANGRRTFINPRTREPVDYRRFLHWHDTLSAAPQSLLKKFAHRWIPPTVAFDWSEKAIEFDEKLLEKCNGFIKYVVRNGPAEWRFENGEGGRSRLLQRMAHEAFRSGLSPEEALGLLYACNEAWGKYETPERAAKYLPKMVEVAYG